jgi:hypothetical protein
MTKKEWNWSLAWLMWGAFLLVCPIALLVLANVYSIPPQPPPWERLPWPAQIAEKVMWAHVGLSFLASLAVPWLVRDFYFRLVAWGAIAFIGFLTLLVFVAAFWATSGRYL